MITGSVEDKDTQEATWKLPRHLKLDYILDGLPSLETINTNYSLKAGQYWEITTGNTEIRKEAILEIKEWDILDNSLTVGHWIQYADNIGTATPAIRGTNTAHQLQETPKSATYMLETPAQSDDIDSSDAEELKREQVSRAEEPLECTQLTDHQQEGTVTVVEHRPRRDRLPEGFYDEEPRED
eukprot:gene35676-46276_t